MQRHFEIDFNNLNLDYQEFLILAVKRELLSLYKSQGNDFLKYSKGIWKNTPKTWQEAFCRIMNLDFIMWDGLDEECQEFKEMDWQRFVEDYAINEAKARCYASMNHLEITIEIY